MCVPSPIASANQCKYTQLDWSIAGVYNSLHADVHCRFSIIFSLFKLSFRLHSHGVTYVTIIFSLSQSTRLLIRP